MRARTNSEVLTVDTAEFSEDLRRISQELDRLAGTAALTGECSPPLDVYETDDSVEIVLDLPGVDPSAVRIVAKGDAVLIAGRKAPRRARGDASFHLVERGYGRFARTVRLTHSCDTARARATLSEGELRVSLPKVADRRGRSTPITLSSALPSEPTVA